MQLQHFNTSTLQHFNTSALQHFSTPALQHFSTYTLRHFDTSTLKHAHLHTKKVRDIELSCAHPHLHRLKQTNKYTHTHIHSHVHTSTATYHTHRVGQKKNYMVYTRYFWQGNHHLCGVYTRFWPALHIHLSISLRMASTSLRCCTLPW